MSDEVWWVRRVPGTQTYYAFETKEAAENDDMKKFIRGFYLDEWGKFSGPNVKSGDIIPIRPLRIEVVKEEE